MRDNINEHIHSLKKVEAIGAFYFNNLIFLQGIINAAKNKREKVFVMVTSKVIEFLGMNAVLALKDYVKSVNREQFYFLLDHGSNLDLVKSCINNGFDAVMFDGGNLPLEENIQITKQIVRLAHEKGVWVEGEVGKIPGSKYGDQTILEQEFPTVEVVKYFVQETAVDGLAISFGIKHEYKEEGDNSVLDFDLLKQYSTVANIPLVMHGADTIPSHNIKKAIENGIKKVNYGPVLKDVFLKSMASRLKEPFVEAEMREILTLPMLSVQKVVELKIADYSNIE